ncbi:hypothetical protein [Variovorax sp. KBW07]|uniref:hypothetical protein n=1 Tax=Variovorax sp. KBW07 TaxID=2153358 RepID=UPI0016255B2E|nr:hypothetical protein [Variovorax sp. KBW07]
MFSDCQKISAISAMNAGAKTASRQRAPASRAVKRTSASTIHAQARPKIVQ